jgi:transposase-like protein
VHHQRHRELQRRFRKVVRDRGHFPTEQAELKVRYRVAIERRRTGRPGRPIDSWKRILNMLTIHYGDRFARVT